MDSEQQGEISREELIRSALTVKLEAIKGYDPIIWKIRTAYVAILYGALTLLLGTNTINFTSLAADAAKSFAILLLIFGFSLSAAIVDGSYVSKKLKVLASRDRLVEVALNPSSAKSVIDLTDLLHIGGETPTANLTCPVTASYHAMKWWNVRWILGPLYGVTPALSLIFCCIYKLRFG